MLWLNESVLDSSIEQSLDSSAGASRPALHARFMACDSHTPGLRVTIARRFSSSDPGLFHPQAPARGRGEFIDIHDSGRDPTGYDVLVTM
jgi:hypothetical protein